MPLLINFLSIECDEKNNIYYVKYLIEMSNILCLILKINVQMIIIIF